MAKIKKEVKEVKESKVVKVVKDSATVVYPGGVRTYTREMHGENFADLAKEFADKREGTVE